MNNKLKIAQNIAIGATALSVTGFCLDAFARLPIGMTLMALGFIAGIVAYVFGGFLTAVKMAGGIAKWGWFVVPFPYDLLTVVLAFFFSIYVFAFLPIIPVRKAIKNSELC